MNDAAGKEFRGKIQEVQNDLVLEYLNVRRALGYLGFGLPVVLILYGALPGTTFAPSISEFYYTHMGGVFVGVMCAIGVFLFTYKGYRREPGEVLSDKVLSRIAGLLAIGVAIFPVRVEAPALCDDPGINLGLECHPNLLHFGSATGFFLALAILCIFQFTKGDRHADGSIRWTPDNLIYVGCGTLMILCLLALVPYVLIDQVTETLAPWKYMFVMESLACVAFAVAWLVKGETLKPVRRAVETVAPSPSSEV
ncbi:hypothetical protein [Maritimibacter sp. DP1N21-5]|uniref:hypothetical protein n=1 Tax=Maritimibacter sp. DP1N21-5 TaxID=2836867 RepID=UPI001C4863E3|nr:hypothetical protein [Maritimibacter sp. DP1N21-5]MBV7408801.1 hypothetical protein [Maritimibacter sp. DP1N21-5]